MYPLLPPDAAPVTVTFAFAVDFLPPAVRVAVSLSPALDGAYSTVTAQDFPFPRAVPVQASDVIENAVEPETETVSAPDPVPPVLVSVNVWTGLSPSFTDP